MMKSILEVKRQWSAKGLLHPDPKLQVWLRQVVPCGPESPKSVSAVVSVGPFHGFDSHFHLDRTSYKLWGKSAGFAMEDLLRFSSSGGMQPRYPVVITGGVVNFSESFTYHRTFCRDEKWKHAMKLAKWLTRNFGSNLRCWDLGEWLLWVKSGWTERCTQTNGRRNGLYFAVYWPCCPPPRENAGVLSREYVLRIPTVS